MMVSPNEPSVEVPPDKGGIGWIIGLVVALLALAGWMGWEVYPGLAGQFWPTTEGTVRSMKMFYKAKSIDDVNNPTNYSVELEYEYTVNGTAYTGTAYNTTNNNLTPTEAAEVKQHFQPGAKCKVYYSPLFPTSSVINPQMTISAWGKLVIGLLALLGAVSVVVFVVRESVSPRPSP
jgi:hypothetical protein